MQLRQAYSPTNTALMQNKKKNSGYKTILKGSFRKAIQLNVQKQFKTGHLFNMTKLKRNFIENNEAKAQKLIIHS